MGPDMVNENKMYVTFKCDPIVGAWHCVKIMAKSNYLFSPLYLSPFSLVGIGSFIVEVHHYIHNQ
jgi:hypothetical protein